MPTRNSAEICDFRLARIRRHLPLAVTPFGKAAGDMIRAVYWSRSVHNTAILAAPCLGCSVDTAERLINAETKRVDSDLLLRCLDAYQAKFKRPFPIGNGAALAIVSDGGGA